MRVPLFRLRHFLSTLAFGAVLAGGQFQAQAGLIGLYTFNDGTASDVSGNGNHATANTATFVGGGGPDGDGAFDFSGSLMTVPININPGALPALTMGAFVRADTTGGTGAGKVISHDDGGFDRTLGLDFRGGSGTGYAAFTGTTVLRGSTEPFPNPAFRFIAVRYNGTTVKIDVDGASAMASDSTGGSGFTSTTIGANPGFSEAFDGIIDNVFFFDEFLSDSAISAIRTGGTDHLLSLTNVTIPEPGTLAIFGLGLAGLGLARRKKAS